MAKTKTNPVVNFFVAIYNACSRNRSRVAIFITPFVTPLSGKVALLLSQYLGLSSQDATLVAGAVVVGVLTKLGLYIKNNGLQEGRTNTAV